MQFTFLDMAGKTMFVRDDAERAQWTQEEMTLDLEFPRLEDKVISIGQRIFFKDPTGASQIYEVKQARTLEPDNYQTIVAENICISELSDEHIDNSEIDNKTASNALQGVLNGTLWRVGDSLTNPASSGDISRGSVWQAVLEIKDNWNVYIEPRVVLNSDGSITRYLDIVPTSGVWNGLRLSIDKNMLDPSVTFDDSEVVTALYGYGGTIQATTPEGENEECNFKDVVWSATSQHPAKPRGQAYIEDPAATLAYGRNGRARFGFYQNTDITDPEILLQKTWESLKTSSKPAISIDGTVADLYRMGYADTPIKLHDIALVEVNPAGYKDQIQIIRITTDLLDPSATTLTIGSYIPNIVYIERQTNESATGSRGGGGGNKSNETAWKEFRTTMEAYEDGTGMRIRSVQNDLNNTKEEVAVQEAQIEVAYNRITQEVTDRRNADSTLQGRITVEANRITQEVTDRRNGEEALSGRITVEKNRITQEVNDRTNADNNLSGRITVEAGKITQIVSAVGKDGQVTAASICLAINNGGSTATINAGKIYLLGQTIADTITADYIKAKIATIPTLTTNSLVASNIQFGVGGGVYGNPANAIMNLQLHQDGNSYQIWGAKFNGEIVKTDSFSRATSLSGSWSGNIYTVTASPQGNTLSVVPAVHVKGSQGGNYVDVCVGVHNGISWTDHGSNQRLTLSVTSLRVDLIDSNGGILATTTATNPYPSSMTLSQKTNASGSRQFTAYYLNGSTYVSMGQAYWYSSGTNLNTSSKTVHY